MKKVLLAGGAGFIGSLLTKELIGRKYDVTVADLFWFGNYLPKNAKVIQKNVIDLKEEELKGYDVVVFMGGVSNDPMADSSAKTPFLVNH